jgi:hypothetical protein
VIQVGDVQKQAPPQTRPIIRDKKGGRGSTATKYCVRSPAFAGFTA